MAPTASPYRSKTGLASELSRGLSVAPAAVPRVKAAVRDLDVGRCASLAREALAQSDADDVRKLVLARVSEAAD